MAGSMPARHRSSKPSWPTAPRPSPSSTRRRTGLVCTSSSNMLHQTPALVPLIVLVAGHRDLRRAAGLEVLLALRADADPATGADRRHRRRRAIAGDPDRRHRPVASARSWCSARSSWASSPSATACRSPVAILCGLALRHAVRLHQRLAGGQGQAAAVHRDAGHVADRAGDQLPLFRERDDPQPGHRDERPVAAVLRRKDQDRRRGLHLWRHLHDRCWSWSWPMC